MVIPFDGCDAEDAAEIEADLVLLCADVFEQGERASLTGESSIEVYFEHHACRVRMPVPGGDELLSRPCRCG